MKEKQEGKNNRKMSFSSDILGMKTRQFDFPTILFSEKKNLSIAYVI